MKRFLPVLIGLLLGVVVGWFWGFSSGRFQAGLEENKVAAVCLRADDLIISADLREYLKGRIYYNLASKYPNDPGYLLRRDWDFGTVDLSLLKRRIYVKDPTFPSESFDAATSHLSKAERPN
jgi:hypothetical protein